MCNTFCYQKASYVGRGCDEEGKCMCAEAHGDVKDEMFTIKVSSVGPYPQKAKERHADRLNQGLVLTIPTTRPCCRGFLWE